MAAKKKVPKKGSKKVTARGKKLQGLLAVASELIEDGGLEELLQARGTEMAKKTPVKKATKKKAVAKKKASAKKAPAKKAAAKSNAVITTVKGTKTSRVALNWKQVWYSNCPMVSANNVDQELGWCREEFKKIGVEYDYFRHVEENDFYPHYIHSLDNLIRFGGLYPPVAVNADIRETVLLGATNVYEGGCMVVRAGDDLYRMKDLKGKRIALSKSLNVIKNDWWRIQEHMGILNMLRLNDMTMDDIDLVEFPYPDDWYNDPKMLTPMNNPSETWLRRDHKHDLAFRPEESALLKGKVDAIYTQSKVFQHLQEDTGKLAMIEDLSRYPDWRIQVANTPAVITCTKVMADKHPELVHAYMKAMVRVGRWSNDNKKAAAVILDHQTFYRDPEDTYEGIKHVDMVPSLNAKNMQSINIGKDFMFKHGYIKNDFDVDKWARPEFLEDAVQAVFKEEWEKKSWSKLEKGGGLETRGVRI